MHGRAFYWYENGIKQMEKHMYEGQEDGSYATYFPNGDKNIIGNYKRGKKDGLWQYFNDSKIMTRQEFYVNEHPEGKWLEFYKEGPRRSIIHYKKGQREGVCKEFDITGPLVLKVIYKHGKIAKTKKDLREKNVKQIK
jgi:uncharacterized protein